MYINTVFFTNYFCLVFRQRVLSKCLQSSSQTSTFHESVYIQPRKKRRISDDVSESISDLVNDRDSEKAWPMIQISAILFKKYPDCLKFDEYVAFLETIIKLMIQAFKNFYIMESLCELTTVLVKNESRYEKSDLKSYWDKICDMVLR